MSEVNLEITLTLSEHQSYLFLFEHSPIYIGRGARCELCIPLSSISAQHLSLSWSSTQGIVARDLNAKNKAEYRGQALIGEISEPKRLTLSLPGALIDAKLVPVRARATSTQERNHHLRSLWNAADGWLLEWQPKPETSLNTQTPLDKLISKKDLQLIPLPFGERLALRAELGQPQGLPTSLLEIDLSLESAEWGLTITDSSGQQHALKPGEQILTDQGLFSLPTPKTMESRRHLSKTNSLIFICILILIALLILWVISRDHSV